jgi:hypothetical protein
LMSSFLDRLAREENVARPEPGSDDSNAKMKATVILQRTPEEERRLKIEALA